MKPIFFKEKLGATFKAVLESSQTGARIVCQDLDAALSISKNATWWKYSIPTPVTSDEFQQGFYYRGDNKITIVEKRCDKVEAAPLPEKRPAAPIDLNKDGQWAF